MDFTFIGNDKLQLLAHNYWYLFDLYRLGKFETRIDPEKFQYYQPGLGTRISQTLKPAADDLYLLAEAVEKETEAEAGAGNVRERAAELILRARVLSYEIDDYFLAITPAKSQQFINLSRTISLSPDDYFAAHYSFVSDPEKQKKILQYLLLTALCGINELYRQHNRNDYDEGLDYGERILVYVRNELPRLPCPPRSGKGVVGLCCYIMGRLNFALGHYQKADSYFRESVEAYSERLQTQQRESPESLLATLRRCALASVFGSAYLALIDGKVNDAINVSALARGILKQNCGQVYEGYADLIYWAAKRAVASSDKESLSKVRYGLRRCRRTFKQYVPETHYVHRTGIQLGVAYHYLAEIHPDRRNRYYQLATAYLEHAAAFARTKVDGRVRNQRMLAEALVVLSHITSNRGGDHFETDLEQAYQALEAAKGITQYTCEAYLSLASIYCAKAQRSSAPKLATANVMKARECANQALAFNKNGNTRIRATAYLRLAQLSFLLPNTLPEVRYYYEKWLTVKDSVQHAFLHEWGEKINDEMLNEHLFIDAGVSFNTKYWNSRVEEHLMYAAVRELARQPHDGPRDQARSKKTPRTRLKTFLMDKFEIEKADAYKKINQYKLLDKLREYSY